MSSTAQNDTGDYYAHIRAPLRQLEVLDHGPKPLALEAVMDLFRAVDEGFVSSVSLSRAIVLI